MEKKDSARQPRASSTTGNKRRKPIVRVLIVEGLDADAQLVRRELVRDGMSVEMWRVEREEDFRRALQTFVPHIILSDLATAQFDGMAALAIAREAVADVPFIFVSGTPGKEAASCALRDGAVDYVLKSNMQRLPSLVRGVLRVTQLRAGARRSDG